MKVRKGGASVWVLVVIIVLALLVVLGTVYYLNSGDTVVSVGEKTEGNIVRITSEGFVPSDLIIKVGDSVTWINEDANPHWPATVIHPTHLAYPGSDARKCGTTEDKNIFDACGGLSQGQQFSFEFNYKGRWPYHDHYYPERVGVIIVQ